MEDKNTKMTDQNITAYDDEINLFELWQVIWKRKVMIISITLAAAIISVAVSLMMPNIYRSEVVLAPTGEDGKKGGAAALLSQFGGLASMAGISVGASSTEINLAVLKSRTFIKSLVNKNKLMPHLFPDKWDEVGKTWIEADPKEQPTLWDAYRKLVKSLSISTDKKSNLTTVSLERKDPEEAAKWLKIFIETLNNHLRNQAIQEAEANIDYLETEIEKTPLLEMRQTLYSVIAEQTKQIMLAKSQKNFAFKIIDAPEVPDKKSKPKRSLIVIIMTFFSGISSVFIAFFCEYIEKQKKTLEHI